MPVILQTVGLLALSNTFMTFAWYAHLKHLNGRVWIIAALVSWGIALFEYLLRVPANRIGYTELSLAQLKILQEVVTLSVFVPFAIFYMHQPLKLDYLWAAICLLGPCTSCSGAEPRNRLSIRHGREAPVELERGFIAAAQAHLQRQARPAPLAQAAEKGVHGICLGSLADGAEVGMDRAQVAQLAARDHGLSGHPRLAQQAHDQ